MRTLLCQITSDFLVRGTREPLELAPEGARALRSAAVLAELGGELTEGLEELLDLTYWLDGKGDSRSAASAIRAAIAAVPGVRAALGVGVAGGEAIDEATLI